MLTLKCASCDLVFEMDDADPHCPACGGSDLFVRERVKLSQNEMLWRMGLVVIPAMIVGGVAWWWLWRSGLAPSTLTVVVFFAVSQLVDAWSTYRFLSVSSTAKEVSPLPRKLFEWFGLRSGLLVHTLLIASVYCAVFVSLGHLSVLFVVAFTKVVVAVNNYRQSLAADPLPATSITG